MVSKIVCIYSLLVFVAGIDIRLCVRFIYMLVSCEPSKILVSIHKWHRTLYSNGKV